MYWFGRIVGDFIGNQRILPIYLLGAYWAAFLLSFGQPPALRWRGHYALGASAAVMAIVVNCRGRYCAGLRDAIAVPRRCQAEVHRRRARFHRPDRYGRRHQYRYHFAHLGGAALAGYSFFN